MINTVRLSSPWGDSSVRLAGASWLEADARPYPHSKRFALTSWHIGKGCSVADLEPPDLRVVPPSDSGQKPNETEEAPEELSARETRFSDELASGTSLADAASAVGISPRSARRWRKKPEIAEAVRARLSENVSMARAILSAGASKAAIGLVDMASGTAPAESARVSAARGVLESTMKLTELEDVIERLAALEAQLANHPGNANRSGKGR